ncbi:MAG: VCBS repeat-containing protein [Bryobacteraceae bacterium]
MKKAMILAAALAVCAISLWSVSRPPDIPFERHTIDLGANETCALADINKDGRLDIVAGENWYAAPKWTKNHFRDFAFANNYIDNFSDLPVDVNGDGYPDIVSGRWFSKELDWWENPGKKGGPWKQHMIESGFNVEFAFLVDLNNDGKALEVLPQFAGRDSFTAYYELKGGQWVRQKVSDKTYGHGIGAGDVNGDGKADVLTSKGWFEAPDWKYHPDWDVKEAMSFIHVTDVDGDKRNDIVFGNAHDYGLAWMKHNADGTWTKQMIDDTWSQVHAVTMADLNGDGKPDIVTGKRWMAHEHENGAREPNGLYWYETITIPPPIGKGQLQWVKHVIDFGGRAGGGMQVQVADIDGDKDLDIAVGGKLGVFLFENKTR